MLDVGGGFIASCYLRNTFCG